MVWRAVILAVCVTITPGSASAQDGLSRDEYERLRSDDVQRLRASYEVAQSATVSAALTQRGHSGDRTLLMGCDLSDPVQDAAAAQFERVVASVDYQTYQAEEDRHALVLAQVAQAVRAPETPRTGDISVWLTAAFEADQAMRRNPPPVMPPALADLQPVADAAWLDATCAMDLAHGSILRDVMQALPILDAAGHRRLHTLLMHADHDPRVQALGASHFQGLATADARYGSLGTSLKDRSEINFGRPQVYGRLYQCVPPLTPTGPATDPTTIDRNRAEVGLPPFLDEASRACTPSP